MLTRLAGLTSGATAAKAWETPSRALSPGVPAAIEVVRLPVHDRVTRKHRTRDDADEAHQALEKAAMVYRNKEGRVLKAAAIRSKPPAIRRRGKAMKDFHIAVENAFLGRTVVQKHGPRALAFPHRRSFADRLGVDG